jgi:hypothetical protein
MVRILALYYFDIIVSSIEGEREWIDLEIHSGRCVQFKTVAEETFEIEFWFGHLPRSSDVRYELRILRDFPTRLRFELTLSTSLENTNCLQD